jgi:ParB-like chromosome segregation protein Spo0J
LLAEAEGPLPPILVHRATMQIIDDFHRVSAALCKGLDEVEAYLLDGPSESAFIVAVEANLTHRGLPQTHAHWWDRAIASSTGLSTRTGYSVCRSGKSAVGQAVR